VVFPWSTCPSTQTMGERITMGKEVLERV